ncbi:MAG: hypothetical protein RJA16_1141 [Planctomycetota bacterium]|jgi:hypothetical protein
MAAAGVVSPRRERPSSREIHADRAALAGLLERSASALGSVIEDFSFTRAVVRLPTMSSLVLLR